MKAKMKKMIDVDELIDRLNTSDVPYCATLDDIIAKMPTVSMYEVDVKADDYPKYGNGDFEIAPCNCEDEPAEEVPAYVNRMIAEYHELKDKYTKLHRMLIKHEAGTLDFEPTCPIELLEHQANVMGEYLHTLEVRAEIENVKL